VVQRAPLDRRVRGQAAEVLVLLFVAESFEFGGEGKGWRRVGHFWRWECEREREREKGLFGGVRVRWFYSCWLDEGKVVAGICK
jgi:hypothetical protein